jgi:hypothetical protein
MLLDGHYANLLTEWLTLLHRGGMRVPAAHLPALLDHGSKHSDLHPLIQPVLGRRGVWLAAQNPAWAYAQDVSTWDVEQVWHTGSRDERARLLAWLREHDPARARELLEATWQQDPAKERAAFLEVLKTNLSMADEPFLESALDDRSKDVRRTAADLLAHLPDSRLVQRMIERVQPLLSFEPGGMLKKASLEVRLPAECTPEMQRDGVEVKPTSTVKDEHAWWLQQMLGVVPPAFWSDTWQVAPREIVESIDTGNLRRPLQEGWLQAARIHHDSAWAAALHPFQPNEIITLLAPDEAETLLVSLLKEPFTAQTHAVLQSYPFPWSLTLAHTVIRLVERLLGGQTDQSKRASMTTGINDIAAYRMPPEVGPEASVLWTQALQNSAQDTPMLTRYVEQAIDILQFRRDMHEALQVLPTKETDQ